MAKNKPGLQKEVSKIFMGLQIPTRGGTKRPAETSQAEQKPESGEPGPQTQTPAGQTSQTAQPMTEQSVAVAERPPLATPKTLTKSQPPSQPNPKTFIVPDDTDTSGTNEPIRELPARGRIADMPARIGGLGKQSKSPDLLGSLNQIFAKLLAPKPGVDPRRQKAMLLLMPVLLVGMIVAILTVLRSGGVTGDAAAPNFAPSAADAVQKIEIAWKTPPPYPLNMRDPMQTYSVRANRDQGAGTLRLTAIVYSEEQPSAVVNQEIVFQGTVIDGATVLKINLDSVEFQMDGKKWTQKVER
jgi:hypothetical protein